MLLPSRKLPSPCSFRNRADPGRSSEESSAAEPSTESEAPSSSVVPSTSSSSSSSAALTTPTTLTNTYTSTDANGVLYTITQTIRNGGTNGGQSSAAAGGAAFLDNTGAVAGTFVAVGLVVTASVMAFIFFMLKRRRRQRLDRDVAAAAAAAAAASGHKGYDDEDDNGPAMTQYGGYYSTNGMEVLDHPQPRMDYDYEDPAGGYDHYAQNLTPGDRMSTATAAGMAGFGAHSAQQNYHQSSESNEGGFNAVTSDEHHTYSQSHDHAQQQQQQQQPMRQSNGYYFDPNSVNEYAIADEPYGGYDNDNDQHHAPPQPAHHRSGSEGSVSRGDNQDRGLKITNV